MGDGRELEAVRKDGSSFPVEIGLNPIETENGTKIITDVTDITYYKKCLEQKKTLLKEVFHRVKNHLQIIVSLLNLESKNTPNKTPEEILSETKNRVQSMALLHDVIFQGDHQDQLSIADYIKQLVKKVRTVSGAPPDLSIDYDLEDVILDLETSLYCGLIVNEAVTNALKHAIDGNGEKWIKISFSARNDGTYRCSVADSGPGLPDSLEPRESESTGMRIMRKLAEYQLNGEIRFKNTNGTKIEFTFPG